MLPRLDVGAALDALFRACLTSLKRIAILSLCAKPPKSVPVHLVTYKSIRGEFPKIKEG